MKIKRQIYNKFKKNRCCVLIPTYNNAKTLEKVISEILIYTDQIIVLNDGSTDNTEQILSKFKNIKKISYEKNRGKGAVLKKGFKIAYNSNYLYAITIDSDGQHLPQDLVGFIDKLENEKSAIIIGSRNMNQSTVPGKSSFGNRFSNFWFKFETGLNISDTQSGYRLYPLELLKDIKFFTNKYEFEIEVIVRAAWRNIKIVTIPVRVIYFEKEKRVSHFRPVRDFTRVSILNTVLVAIVLVYIKPFKLIRSLNRDAVKSFIRRNITHSKESNLRITFAVVLGVFMGIAPIWGYQLAVAILLAIFFRLNKIIVIVAAHISLPPAIPFIIYASFKVGEKMLNSKDSVSINYSSLLDLGRIKINFFQYVIGSIALGSMLAIAIGLITFLCLLFFRKPKLK